MNKSTIVGSKNREEQKREIAKVCACECAGKDNTINKGMQIEIPTAGEYNQMYDKINVFGAIEMKTKKHIELKEAGEVLARIDCKTKQPLIADGIDEKQVLQAIKKYMKEHGLKTIDEVIAMAEAREAEQEEQDEAR